MEGVYNFHQVFPTADFHIFPKDVEEQNFRVLTIGRKREVDNSTGAI